MIELTATQLPRFMACPGSYFLPAMSNYDGDDKVREEGIAAHWLVEQLHSGQFSPEELVDRKAPNGVYITSEMVEETAEYRTDLKGDIEFDTSFSGKGYKIKARADNVSFVNGILEVRDFKYGWALVEVEENWTLIAHAIGYALCLVHRDNINFHNDIRAVVFKIYQPRPFHPQGRVREWSISAFELEEYHKKLNAVLGNPQNQLNTGSWCKHCPSAAVCSANIKASMNAIDVSEKPYNMEVTDDELPNLLENLNRAKKNIENTLAAYEEVTSNRLREGRVIKGYALEQAYSFRAWKKNVTVELLQMLTGRNDLSETKLISPAQAVKKGLSEDTVKSLSDREKAGMKLCKVDPTKKVEKIFGDFLKQQKGK